MNTVHLSFLIVAMTILCCCQGTLAFVRGPSLFPSTTIRNDDVSSRIQRSKIQVPNDPTRRDHTQSNCSVPILCNHKNNSPLLLYARSQKGEDPVARTTTRRGKRFSRNTLVLAKSSAIYLTSCIVLAKLHVFGSGYTDAYIAQDLGVTVLTTVLALLFVKTITQLAARGVLEARDSRKIIHMLSAPLFILCWPLFSSVWGARFFAAFVPALQALRLWLAGTASSNHDSYSTTTDYNNDDDNDDDSMELANAISRSGDREEALGGPFIYVVILFSAIMLSFRDNLSGVIALSTMAAGDGMADIIGRRYGKNNKWFFSEKKSVAGTLGFLLTASMCSIGLVAWLMYTHSVTVTLSMGVLISRIVWISAISAFVELIPGTDDNWSVPITAGILSYILIP